MIAQDTMELLIEKCESLAWEAIQDVKDNECEETRLYWVKRGFGGSPVNWQLTGEDYWDEVELKTLLRASGAKTLSGKSIKEARHAFVKTFIDYGCWQTDGYDY